MTPKALNIYKKQKDDSDRNTAVMQDISAWLNGFYTLKAIGRVLSKDATYPNKHMFYSDADESELTEEEIEEMVQENTQIAAINFAAWADAANAIME